MKNKIIKNIGIMAGTSNLAFASATSGGIKDEKLEDKEEFKGIVRVLKDIVCENIKPEDLAKEIFSKLYKCTKTENKKSKINILNYSLNFGTKIGDVKDFFKGKIKIAKDKKNVIVLKKNPIFVPLQETEENILKSYKSLLKEECIILELNDEGSVEKLYNTTVGKDKNELSKKVNGEHENPGENPGKNNFDTKNIFETVLNNNALQKSKFISIIKSLNDNKLGYGLHDSGTYNIDLDGYIVIDVDGNGQDMLSTTHTTNIEASIKSNISSISICGSGKELSAKDVIIAQKKINNNQKLLIAKAEDVSKGKIGNNTIDKEFYKSDLEDFFATVNKLSNSTNLYKALIQIFIDEKYDCGQYQLDEATVKKFRPLIAKGIILNKKGLEWICLRDNETSGTYNPHGFKKDIDFSGRSEEKKVTSNGTDKGGYYLKKNDIVVAVESNKNLLLIARASDISAGTVNGQTIDESFYETTTGK